MGQRRLKQCLVWIAMAGVLAATTPLTHAMTNGAGVPDPAMARWVATLENGRDGPLVETAGCGGALVTPDRVVTAAHCVNGHDPRQIQVHVNARVLSANPGVVRGVRGVAILPGFRTLPSPVAPHDEAAASARYDLAVLLLDQPIGDIAPLPVAPRQPAAGAAITLFSHGLTGGSVPFVRDDLLFRGELAVVPPAVCAASTPATVDPALLCGQDIPGRTSNCWHDRGSPAVSFAHGRPELVGIASFGSETANRPCTPSAPVAFTDAADVRRWILGPLPQRQPYPGTPAVAHRDGGVVRCELPRWDSGRGLAPESVDVDWVSVIANGPHSRELPIDDAKGPRLDVTADLAGLDIACRVHARSSGGDTVTQSEPLPIS